MICLKDLILPLKKVSAVQENQITQMMVYDLFKKYSCIRCTNNYIKIKINEIALKSIRKIYFKFTNT